MRLILVVAFALFSTVSHAGICEKYKTVVSAGVLSMEVTTSGTPICPPSGCRVYYSTPSCKYDAGLQQAIKNQLNPKIGNKITDNTLEDDLSDIHYAIGKYESWTDSAYEGMTPELCRIEAYKNYLRELQEKIRQRCAVIITERNAKAIEKTLPVPPQF